MRHLRLLSLCAATVLFLAGCDRGGAAVGGWEADAQEPGEGLARVGTLPAGVDAGVGDTGREVYGRFCVVCHGERGQGTLLGPAFSDTTDFEAMVSLVRDGAASDSFPVPMNPRGDGSLGDDEVRAVAAYVFSISRGQPGN